MEKTENHKGKKYKTIIFIIDLSDIYNVGALCLNPYIPLTYSVLLVLLFVLLNIFTG